MVTTSEKKNHRLKVQSRLDYAKDLSDEEVSDEIDEYLMDIKETGLMPVNEKVKLGRELFDSIRRLDILQKYIEETDVTEIMVNGPDNILVERKGKIEKTDEHFDSIGKLNDVIQQIAAGCNRAVNESSPIVDARLSDGSRVNIVLNPVALNGPILTIRRFPVSPLTMDDLIKFNSVSNEAALFLKKLVAAGYNIFVSGGTGSGKTTFLNVLSGFVPQDERVITIEDSAELKLVSVKNLVSLECRNANTEGCKEINIRDLIKTSLRMRPDRIIVGEVRGSEAVDMLQCLNTGHDGSMSTGHANSAKDMLIRLENMVLMGLDIPIAAIRQQIAGGLDILIHLSRLRDKSRRVIEIYELDGIENGEIKLNLLFEFEEEGEKDGKVQGKLKRRNELIHTGKLRAAGLL